MVRLSPPSNNCSIWILCSERNVNNIMRSHQNHFVCVVYGHKYFPLVWKNYKRIMSTTTLFQWGCGVRVTEHWLQRRVALLIARANDWFYRDLPLTLWPKTNLKWKFWNTIDPLNPLTFELSTHLHYLHHWEYHKCIEWNALGISEIIQINVRYQEQTGTHFVIINYSKTDIPLKR